MDADNERWNSSLKGRCCGARDRWREEGVSFFNVDSLLRCSVAPCVCPDPERNTGCRSLERDDGSGWVTSKHVFCRDCFRGCPVAVRGSGLLLHVSDLSVAVCGKRHG